MSKRRVKLCQAQRIKPGGAVVNVVTSGSASAILEQDAGRPARAVNPIQADKAPFLMRKKQEGQEEAKAGERLRQAFEIFSIKASWARRGI
jgi:hypothetical protein